ncbi:hypothetical protein H5410_063183 [Solanum commersonii]|uniref:Transcription factor n=1 Tax=Solanum commersonii TaxID=4109 RepID=A0A9J5WCL1_SOLCO|nr:hypothetical protein H5410_063183 [Solanum commersonii]
MEQMGAFFDEEYCQSLSKMFFNENSSDFMFQLHGEDNIIEGSFFSSSNSHTLNSTSNIDYFSQENSIDSRGSGDIFFLNNNTSHEYLQHNYDVESTNFYMMGNKNLENSLSNDDYVMKENIGNSFSQLDIEMLLKRKFDKVEVQSITEEEKFKESENPKKKSKVDQKIRRIANPKAKKNQKNIQMNNEEVGDKETNNNVQSTSCCSSEDDSNLKTKTRASRGAATDPQSLYARVDLSTMLEEAVHYVKFLQTQIKLLSSDDMWMYAPIAYNGMGIDL